MSFLIKPASYALILLSGAVLRSVGFFKKEDYRILTKILANVTLPCAVVTAFDGFQVTSSLPVILLLGILSALIPLLFMYLTGRGRPVPEQAYRMVNIGGKNIGCFSLPVLEAFLGPSGVVTACIFDIGNAIMNTGGVYVLASTLSGRRKVSVKTILEKFLSSVPFDIYLVMIVLTALKVQLPEAFYELISPAAKANGFVAMMSIGMMFELPEDHSVIGKALRQLSWHYIFGAVFAAALLLLSPFDAETNKTLVILFFAPLSALAPMYTDLCHGDTPLACLTNTVSIPISFLVMTVLALVL